MKKTIIFFLFLILINSFSSKKTIPLPPPPANFDEMLKDVDFDKMLKELEEIFGESDAEDEEETDEEEEEEDEEDENKSQKKAPLKEAKPLSKKDNFEQPAGKKDSDKPVKKLQQEKLKAFYHYTNKFLDRIEQLETAVNSFAVGIWLKETLEDQKPSFKQIINDIKVELRNIQSKKLYIKFFFLPTYNNVRKNIIDSLKDLKKLNKQIKTFKLTEEEQEQKDIELLQKLAKKEKVKTLTPKEKRIQKEAINILKNSLSPISKDLKKITVSSQVKSQIESKRKKREQEEKSATQRAGRSSSYSPSWSPSSSSSPWSSRSDYGSGYSPSYSGSGYSPSYSPSRRWSPSSRRSSPGYSPSSSSRSSRWPRSSGSKSRTPSLSSSRDTKTTKDSEDKKTGIVSGKANKKFQRVLSFTTKAADTLNQIKDIYKEDDPTTYTQVLNSQKLTNLADTLKKIEDNKAQLNQNQIKKLEKNQTYKKANLQKSLNEFIPALVRLAKHPQSKDEQEVARKILADPTIKLQTVDTETQKYEKTIIDKLKNKENQVKDFNIPDQDLKDTSNNLKILLTQPQSDIQKVTDIKRDFLRTSREAKNKITGFIKALNDIKDKITIATGAGNINNVQQVNNAINAIVDLPQKNTVRRNAIEDANTPTNVGNAFNQNSADKIKANLEKYINANLTEREQIISDMITELK